MKKETIKSVILTLLILNCLQLTGQIWLSEKLWPSGYNFFHSVQEIPILGAAFQWLGRSDTGISDDALYEEAVRPARIVMNSGRSREVYGAGDSVYTEIIEYAKGVMAPLFAQTPRTTSLTTAQWQLLFKGKSVYMEFGFAIDGTNLAQFCNTTAMGESAAFPVTTGVLLVPDSVSNEVILCVQDGATGVVTKYWTGAPSSTLQEYIDKLPVGKQHGYTFAFELNLDKTTTPGGVVQKVVLDPLVLLPMTAFDRQGITLHNHLENKESISQAADRIVTAFGYKPSSLRKQVTQTGDVSYVENSGTVRVSADGLISYQAVTGEYGIPLKGARPTARQTVGEVLAICKKIWGDMNVDNVPELHLTSPLVEQNGGDEVTVSMDYCYQGIPVVTRPQDGTPAVYAVIRNGSLQTFQMVLCTMGDAGQTVKGTLVQTAVDRLFEQFADSTEPIKMTNLFECYAPAPDGTVQLNWGMKLSNKQGYTIAP